MENLNKYQMQILNNVMFTEEAGFSELNTDRLPTDQFNYHLKQLLKLELISKNDSGSYILTEKGKEFCGRIDLFTSKIEKQPKTCVLPVCIQEIDGVKKYLLHKRTKQPHFGFYGFPSGKAKEGNFLSVEVLRELEEETGLKGTPVLKEIKQTIVQNKSTGKFFEDRIFYCFRIDNIQGKLLEKTIEGENYWLSLDEIKAIDKIFPDTFHTIESIEKLEGITYVEEIIDSIEV